MSPNFEILIGLEFLFYGPVRVWVRVRVRVRVLGLGLRSGLELGLGLGVMVVRMDRNIFREPIKREVDWETLQDLAVRIMSTTNHDRLVKPIMVRRAYDQLVIA